MVSGGDFQEKHLNRQPGVRTGFRFSGPGPIRDRNGGRVPQNTKKTTAKQSILGPPFSIFPGIHVKTYIIVYVFWYFWSPFPWISCHTSKTIDSVRTGRRGFDAIFVTFSRPEKRPINSYVYVGILRWFFKNTGFRENELNPPSAVRSLLEAFHIFQFRGLVGIPT